jgi:signal transduction histidine kinase
VTAVTLPTETVSTATVFIVDDDPSMRQSIIDILDSAGISGHGFGSGAAALAPDRPGQPDLAIVDQRLPDTTGIDLSISLKTSDPDLSVILLTGDASADTAIAAVGLVDDYLTKPVPPEDLLRSVRAAADRTRLRRENRRLVARLQGLNSSLEETIAQRTRELEQAHRQALQDQAIKERLRAQAERQQLEARLEQSQRLESLGQLAGGVAHDFNNLLAVILACGNFVADATAGDEPIQADVNQILAAAERAARLTRQLLIFSRRDQANVEILDLTAIVTDMQALLTRTIGEDIQLTVHAPAGLPAIHADRGQIEQVLVNLAVNARDAMPEGGTLTIRLDTTTLDEDYARLHPPAKPGRYVDLSVSDTGIGIPPSVLSRIFEPFFSTKPRDKGTGLGLATVHGIVAGADGSLSVYSEPGIGTTIRAFFPPAENQAVTAEPPPEAASTNGHGQTILVVEDQPAVRQIAARILRNHGYSVIEAGSGAEALTLAASHHFDLLLTDVIMPEMSGPQLAQHLHQAHPKTPVVFMSGYSQDVLGPRKTLDDNAPLIQKPFTTPQLITTIHTLLSAPPA